MRVGDLVRSLSPDSRRNGLLGIIVGWRPSRRGAAYPVVHWNDGLTSLTIAAHRLEILNANCKGADNETGT